MFEMSPSGTNASVQTLLPQFLNDTISHGSVATLLMCGGIFNDRFTANLLLSLLVKKF